MLENGDERLFQIRALAPFRVRQKLTPSAAVRVVWCPHPLLRREYAGRDAEILAARTGEGGTADLHQLGEVGDGWGEYLETLEDFPYERYGIVVPPVEVDDEPAMKASAEVGEVQVVEAKAAL